MVVGVRVVKKWKAWLIGITVFLVIGGISFGTYLFIQKSVADLDAKKSDNESPVLEVKDVTINKGELYKVEDFVNSCEDNLSEECSIEFKEKKMADYKEPGEYEIVLRAIDDKENETLKTAHLVIAGEGENPVPGDDSVPLPSENIPSGDTPSESSPEKEVRKVSVTSKDLVETKNFYGTTCQYVTTVYYDVYSDGSLVETRRDNSEATCDYSGYNATLEDLADEAGTQMQTYADTIAKAYLQTYERRLERGFQALNWDVNLSLAAELRALEIGYSGKYSSERPNTTTFILDELGISYQGGLEYLASDILDAKSMINKILQTSGANESFYNSSYTRIGIGMAMVHNRSFWVIYITQ